MVDSLTLNFWDYEIYLYVFARVSGFVLGMPFLSQAEIPMRLRAITALGITLIFVLIPKPNYYPQLQAYIPLLLLMLSEGLLGFFIGLVARFALAAMEYAGFIIGFTAGLSTASLFNPSQANQGTVVSLFLSIAALTSFLVLDGHHFLFKALHDSFTLIPVDWLKIDTPFSRDMVQGMIRITQDIMAIGLRLSIPFLLVNVVLQLGMGIMNKLIPQVQVFFMTISIQVLLGGFLLLLTIGSILIFFEKFVVNQYIELGLIRG